MHHITCCIVSSHLMMINHYTCVCVITVHTIHVTHMLVFTKHSGIFRGENIYLPWGMLTRINVFGILSKASGSFFFQNVKIFSTVFLLLLLLLLILVYNYIHTYQILYIIYFFSYDYYFPCASLRRG